MRTRKTEPPKLPLRRLYKYQKIKKSPLGVPKAFGIGVIKKEAFETAFGGQKNKTEVNYHNDQNSFSYKLQIPGTKEPL
jgi:hypothetical protein